MEKLLAILLFLLLFPSQAGNIMSNSCLSEYMIYYYSGAETEKVNDRHENPESNEIHIILSSDSTFRLKGNIHSFSNLRSTLIDYQKDRKFISNYYYTIGISTSGTFSSFNDLLCRLKDINSLIYADNEVRLYLFE